MDEFGLNNFMLVADYMRNCVNKILFDIISDWLTLTKAIWLNGC